jgi:hypothetical protein
MAISGEANRGNFEPYACQLAAMIRDWRVKWNQLSSTASDYPFGVVQVGVASFYGAIPLFRQAAHE